MKKILILACLSAFIFVGAAFSEPIEFPNGITVDVAPGWLYEGEGDSAILTAEDKSCTIAIVISKVEGLTSEEAAKVMSKEHNGSEPQKLDEDSYIYSFQNENGIDTNVILGVENGKLKVLSITGDHKDVEGIIDSITEK
ncbi:MAG: hypothetical protein FWF87_02555 [Synergistaceae bacterium]|nr:hypothetical protein [Synergistaceae bacterium]